MISRMGWDKKLIVVSFCTCMPLFSVVAAEGITTANKTSTAGD